jgi:hypothetical protein
MNAESRTSKEVVSDLDYFERLKSRCIVTETGCWEKQGFRRIAKGMERHGTARGYGMMCYRNKNWASHRLAWFLVNGPIPPGMKVLHKCDNPPCCNPDHLELGDDKKNMRDAGKRKRWPRQYRDTCINGHPRTPENMVIHGVKDPKLHCKVCNRAKQRRLAGWPEDLVQMAGAVPKGQRPVGASWKR